MFVLTETARLFARSLGDLSLHFQEGLPMRSPLLESIVARALAYAERASFFAPLLARLTVGFAFVESGWGKLHNLEKVTEFFAELGIPAPAFQALFVSNVELVCGCLVLLGLATRLAAIPLICTMLVALITAKGDEIAGFSDLVGMIEFTYIALLAWLVLAGPGWLALDALWARRSSHALAPTSSAPVASLPAAG
jgi:putative oxidoreductase